MALPCLHCIVPPPCANKWRVALLSNRAACRCSNPRRADYPDKQGNQGNRRRPYQIRVIPFASRRPKPPATFSTPQGIALHRRAMQGNGARRRAMCACVCVLLRACVCESSQNRAGPGVHLSQTSGVVMLSACTRMRVYVHARAPLPPFSSSSCYRSHSGQA